MKTPPYRIETERLLLRCWDPSDAARAKEAVDTSLGQLRPWMPWALDEPKSLDDKIELFRSFRSRFDSGADFVYGIFSRDESEVLGGTGLHPRIGDDALEIGYWIRESASRRGLATEAAAALTHVALAVCEAERVEIHVSSGNEASARIPPRLGFTLDATLRRRSPRTVTHGPRGDDLVFSLFGDEYVPSGTPVLAAFDSAGRAVITG